MSSEQEKEALERLAKILDKIKDSTVIVEGQRDRAALRSFGFKRVVTATRGLWETTELIEDEHVVILSDFDAEGRRIAARLNLFLRGRADRNTRYKLALLFAKLRIKTIEELKTLKIGVDTDGKISSSCFKIHDLRALRGGRDSRKT